MTTVDEKPSTRAGRRSRALDPYLKRLRRLCKEHVARHGPGRRLELEIGGRPLHIEWWVLARGVHGSETGDEHPEHGPLLAHAAALRLKIAADRVRLDQKKKTAGNGLYALQAELMLDTAMGMALMREIQRVIDDEVGLGHMQPAKQWTKLKNDVSLATSELKQLLAESERQRADALSDRLTDQPRAPRGDPEHYRTLMHKIENLEAERKLSQLARKRAREALDRLPSRTEVLVALLAVSLAIWLGFVMLPQRLRDRPMMLTADDLPPSEALVGVAVNFPSLYVTVDDPAWNALSASERTELVQGFSGTLHRAGYSGALFTTGAGRPVAQWLTLTGVRLLEPREIEAAESGPEVAELPPAVQSPGTDVRPTEIGP